MSLFWLVVDMIISRRFKYNPKLSDLYRVKAMCFVCSNTVLDGDVAFTKGLVGEYLGDFTHVYQLQENFYNIELNNCVYSSSFRKCNTFKLKLLWFYHMVLLRKDYVYLNGVLRK
jgi:hypothetical protein